MLVCDIECVGLTGMEEFIDEPTAPANYKDADKIAAYVADAKAKAMERMALDPDLCRVAAIGVWDDMSPDPVSYVSPDLSEERRVLEWFWDEVRNATWPLCGFNVLAYDLPVLIRRSWFQNVPVPPISLDLYRNSDVTDLMQVLSFHGRIKAKSLDFYARRFGIADQVPDTVKGRDIPALVAQGAWDAVQAHVEADVRRTALLATKLHLANFHLPQEV